MIILFSLYRDICIDGREYRNVSQQSWACWKKTLRGLWEAGEADASFFQGGIAYQIREVTK